MASPLVAKYRKFKHDLCGFVDVPFEVFRKQLLPLARKTEWTAEDVELIRQWAEAGADYALSALYGNNYHIISGGKSVAPPPMTKEELDRHMQRLVKSCTNAGWTRERFAAYQRYLRSDMSVQQLADQDKARQKDLATTGQASAQSDEPDTPASTEGVEVDAFAFAYRNAGAAYRATVDAYLLK